MADILAQARQIYTQAAPGMLKRRNVVACGLGYKIRGETPTRELSMVVSVERKVPPEALTAQDLVPQSLEGMPTDVIEIGRVRAQLGAQLPDPRTRQRPAQPGLSIGHTDVTAGTLGFLVRRGNDTFLLSNNHVLANRNAAKVGDPILQPGRMDGGAAPDAIASLSEFMPLDFGEQSGKRSFFERLAEWLNALAQFAGSTQRFQTVQLTPGRNLMDAALAQVADGALVTPEILGIGRPSGVAEPELGQAVQKMGRTTGLTQGVVTQIDVTVNIDFDGRNARFEDQIIASRMSAPGDSGSGILDMDRRAVGLLFAGSERVTLFTPLVRILQHFRVVLA